MTTAASILQIEQEIVKARSTLERYEQRARDAAGFAQTLALSSLQERVRDLEQQLRQEKLLRGREVLDFRLLGLPEEDSGAIPLHLLGSFASKLASSLIRASQFKNTGKQKGPFPKSLLGMLDLQLAGLAYGSTRLLITAQTAPDLFGRSLAEETLADTFDLVEAEQPEQLLEAVSALGHVSTGRLDALFKEILEEGLEIELRWDAPTGEDRHWLGKRADLVRIVSALESVEALPEAEQVVEGEVVELSQRNSFIAIDTGAGTAERIFFPDVLLTEVQALHLGQIVAARVARETFKNRLTEEEKATTRLRQFLRS